MENVKGYEQKILQKIHFQFCVGYCVKRMQIGVRKRMKFFWAVLKKNDDMNRPDVFVIEVFGVTVFDALVLAKQKVCRVTGSAFAGKAVADFLYLDIGDASIFKFDDDIRDQKRRFHCNSCGVIWQNF